MQMYFEITDPEAVAKIDDALKPIHAFDEKLYELQKKYGADTPYVFNSLDHGLRFNHFWFESFPFHLDTDKEFKFSTDKNKTGYELRPRKSNKEFYSEFMKDLEGVNYTALKLALFGNANERPSLTFSKNEQTYFIMSSASVVLPNQELTATQYKDLKNNKEEGND